MRKFGLGAAAAATLAGAVLSAGAASAAPSGSLTFAVNQGVDQPTLEQVQFFFGGRNYCWYDGGWRGPGWYWCGYAWRRGFGWGGGYGWHGWHGGRRGGGWHGGGWHGGGFRGGYWPLYGFGLGLAAAYPWYYWGDPYWADPYWGPGAYGYYGYPYDGYGYPYGGYPPNGDYGPNGAPAPGAAPPAACGKWIWRADQNHYQWVAQPCAAPAAPQSAPAPGY
jgi:hypothetical protein